MRNLSKISDQQSYQRIEIHALTKSNLPYKLWKRIVLNAFIHSVVSSTALTMQSSDFQYLYFSLYWFSRIQKWSKKMKKIEKNEEKIGKKFIFLRLKNCQWKCCTCLFHCNSSCCRKLFVDIIWNDNIWCDVVRIRLRCITSQIDENGVIFVWSLSLFMKTNEKNDQFSFVWSKSERKWQTKLADMFVFTLANTHCRLIHERIAFDKFFYQIFCEQVFLCITLTESCFIYKPISNQSCFVRFTTFLTGDMCDGKDASVTFIWSKKKNYLHRWIDV